MLKAKSTTFIVVPVYNESPVIKDTISSIKSAGFSNIIVVDDGSNDDTLNIIEQTGVLCFHHKINRGKGAAVKTGIEAAKLQGANIIVTMDGDGQHNASDIKKLIKPIKKDQCDVVLGTRTINTNVMPLHKVIANKTGNTITWLLNGLWVTDSQSGFRAFSRQATKTINTHSSHYEYETDVIREIKKHNLRFSEVPINVNYTEYSSKKPHRQNLTNGLKTLYKLIWDKIS
jgi:glycosyltransferase involved in cell wall biosynthesis